MKTIKLITVVLIIFGLSSCSKWLDINTSPNTLPIENGTKELSLTSAEYQLGYVIGNKYAEIGGFLSQYWTQKPTATQYYDYDRYAFDASDVDREWSQMYANVLKDLKFIQEIAGDEKDSNYLAIANLLMAYTFQVQTDMHGDIPFSEALNGEENIAPKYDNQSAVYEGILKLVNDALVLIDNHMTTTPGNDDAIFHGDMYMWWKFANSLKLKVLMRQSQVNPTGVASKLASMSTLSDADFLEPGDMALLPFYSGAGNQNPLYANTKSLGDNNVASSTIGDVLNTLVDPRASVFFNVNSSGNVVGTAQGAAAAGGYPANSPVSTVGGTLYAAESPVILMSSHEVLFLLSEANARGWLSTGSAQQYYEDAIDANLEYLGVGAGSIDFTDPNYAYPTTGLVDEINMIGFQKWIALCGTQNIESWFEARRFNAPLTPSLASQLGAGQLPARIPYPAGEETANTNFPGQKPITSKMWWDL